MNTLLQSRSLMSLVVLLALVATASARENHLMPQPATMEWTDGRLAVDGSFRAAIIGYDEPRLRSAATRFIDQLSLSTGIPMLHSVWADPGATLVLQCAHAGEPVQSIHADESYDLEANSKQAIIKAATPIGILRGLATFMQLVELDSQGFAVPAVNIHDQPRFLWRGLMIDVSRRWIPAEIIKRNLDAMAAVKLNVFHWHLTDDQGFRIESRKFPRLQQMGSDGNYYTQQEVREIVAYARERGIRVVPEFDMPGHSASWFLGYPQLASAPGPFLMERELGVRDAAMDPTREDVYKFVDEFIGEMAGLFPDEYLHIGGDEVNGKQWGANPQIQGFMHAHGMKDHHDLQVYFNQRVLRILQKHHKKMIGWDEVLHPQLPKDIVVQSWRGQSSLAQTARGGYMGILSTGYYLDLMDHASASYTVDPLSGETANLSKDEAEKILGGEACVWTENIDMQNFDSATWPRTAAIAERLWSPANVTDVDSMYRRLEDLSRQLQWLGLAHADSSPMMLGRLAGDANPAPLMAMDEVLEPINCDIRRWLHHYTYLTPLNRLVDATPPESDAARDFTILAGNWSANEAILRRQLTLWRDNRAQVLPLLQSSAILQETAPLADELASLANAGLEALDYLDRRQQPPSDWINRQRSLLQDAAKPQAELRIAITPGVAKLVDAAAAGN
jgi:hexosaminidase